MKGSSNIIMWLTIVLVVSLTMVLGLVLLLLAELYCWPIIRRLRGRQVSTPDAPTTPIVIRDFPSTLENQESPNDIEKQDQENVDIKKDGLGGSFNGSSLIYISNPVYDGNARENIVVDIDNIGTPFETPGSSPSRLETEDSDDEVDEITSKIEIIPPLSPMKKPRMEASSVCLKDVRSLGTSGSDTNSNNGVSSSSLLTPCTSPSL